MAQSPKQLANLTPIKKGQVLNPEGGRAHNKARMKLKKLTIETYREVIELALSSNLAALKQIAGAPETSAVQVGVAVALLKAIQKGDWSIIEQIAQRLVGKIPDQLNVTSNATMALTIIDQKKLEAAMKKVEADV